MTEHGQKVTEVIDTCCGRGSTILKGVGGYRMDEKQVVMCACNNKQMYFVQKAVKETDPEALSLYWNRMKYMGKVLKC